MLLTGLGGQLCAYYLYLGHIDALFKGYRCYLFRIIHNVMEPEGSYVAI